MQNNTHHAVERTGRLDRGDGVHLAWSRLEGAGPVVVFLPGFASDMSGTKAMVLLDYCKTRGQSLLRLDYSGHGASDGRFRDGTIGQWTADAQAVIDHVVDGPMILIGSSMGGWIGLKLALAFGARVVAFIGIAAAPDFTETLLWPTLAPDLQARLIAEGEVTVPSPYGGDLVITSALIEDGRAQSIMNRQLDIDCPIRLLQGQLDPDVPWPTALEIAGHVSSADVEIVLIKDGDHRLSRQRDLDLLTRTLATLLGENGG